MSHKEAATSPRVELTGPRGARAPRELPSRGKEADHVSRKEAATSPRVELTGPRGARAPRELPSRGKEADHVSRKEAATSPRVCLTGLVKKWLRSPRVIPRSL